MWFYVAKSGFMSAILDVRNSLLIAFLATSDRYATWFFFGNFWQNGCRRSLSIVFLAISDRLAILDFLNSLSIAILAISERYRILDRDRNYFRRPFWMSENHFRSHFWPFLIDIGCPKFTFDGDHSSCHFRSICNFFWFFFTKWPPAAILDWTTMSVIELVRDIWMNNACVNF